jgi:hypothetical protein
MGASYNNHTAKHLNINYTSCQTSTADNYPHNCTNEQLSSTLIPQASVPVSPAPQVTTCTVNNLSHSQDDSNCPYMNLCDNNNNDYNINNNNTDTLNSLYEHIQLNINQYTQHIRFNIVRENIHDNIIQTMNTTSGNISENHNDMGELDNNHIVTHLNVNNISSMTGTVNNYSDNCVNEQPSITVIPNSSDPLSPGSNTSRQLHATNLTVLASPDMSYTGTGANLLERSSGSQVGSIMYPLEFVACVTSAGKAQLTTLQSSNWEPRTENGVQFEESTEQPALPMEVSGVHTLLDTE